MPIFPVERVIKMELSSFNPFFLFGVVFFLEELSLSLSRLSEVTIEGRKRRNLKCFSKNLNPSDLSHENS